MSETSMVNRGSRKTLLSDIIPVMILILSSLAIRWILILANKVPFNSDEAIVGLMARHILAGETPIFFYGQSYMGSLDSYLVAGAFLLFGSTVHAIRIIQSILYIIFLLISYQFSYHLFNSRKAALVTHAFLAAAPVNFLLYTTVTLGGYLESLIIGVAILLVMLKIQEKAQQDTDHHNSLIKYSLVLGILMGLGVWVLGITIIFSLTALIILFTSVRYKLSSKRQRIEMILMIVLGGIIGATPIWLYMLNQGVDSFVNELFGSAIAISQPYLTQVGMHLANLFLFGITTILGFRPPWNVKWLILPLIPLVAGAWIYIIWRTFNQYQKVKSHLWIYIWLPSLILLAAFILTPFGIDPSGRYFLPVYFSLALTVGLWVKINEYPAKIAKWALPGIIILFNLGGIIQSSIQSKDGITTQFAPGTSINHAYDMELINFLIKTSNTRGYSTYWVAYPIAFLSDEKIILVPALPYHENLRHTIRDDRYPTYGYDVVKAEKPIYVTANNPNLDVQLAKKFGQKGVLWREKVIGDYHVYYDLSRKVLPQEIGFGINRP